MTPHGALCFGRVLVIGNRLRAVDSAACLSISWIYLVN